jgi:hypothetical protein
MKIIILIFLIINFGVSNSQEIENAYRIDTTNGSITMLCETTNQCRFIINNTTIEQEYYIQNFDNSILLLEHPELDVSIINVSEGDSCPSRYIIVQIFSNKSFYWSPTFGNCNEIQEPVSTVDEILLSFPADSDANRVEQNYSYSLKNHTLVEVKTTKNLNEDK